MDDDEVRQEWIDGLRRLAIAALVGALTTIVSWFVWEILL